MEAIKVSVVVPVYNVDEFLDNTLSDITGQTLREIEIICVDDGSTDNSCKIIEEWMEKDSRIQLIRQKNQYAGVARNNGLKQAHGKYVIFWDADDLFEHNALEVMYAQAEQENSDICICEARKYDNAKEKYIPSDAYLKEDLLPGKQTFNKFDVPDYIFNLTNNVPWNKLYLKEFITKNKLQYQAIKQANDTYFTIMALFLAERITYVKDVLIAYRVNNDESLSGKASDTVFCAYDSWLYAKEHIEKYPDFNLVRFSFLNRALSGFYHGSSLLISEHGIYTREREEELIKASWVRGVYKNIWIEQFKKMSLLAYEKADMVTCLYDHAKDLQMELGCPPEKIRVTPNGINTQTLADLPGKTEEEKQFINAGAVLRVTPIKDVKTMIQAFAFAKKKVKNMKLWIMGPADEDKKYAKECYDLVESLGVQDVEFTGRVNVKDYLGKMDFTLLTSISEGQPLTILESYAAHKPVIATDVGNCRELIYGNNDGFGEAGILTHIMNIEEIAHAMVTMSVNEKDRRRMGEAGYRRVNALYRIDQMKEVYREIYKGFSDRQNLSWTEEPFQISVHEKMM